MEFHLIVDSNYLLNQHVYSLVKSNILYGKLMSTLLDSANKLKKLHSFERVYFVSDARHSWRKKIYPEYKGTRKKDTSVDWNFVFTTYDQFKAKCSENKIAKVFEHQGIEGDDWIAKLVKRNNAKGISNLIVSSDKDLLQLVKCSTQKPNYMNMMMNNEHFTGKLYLPKGYELLLEEHSTPSNSLFGVEEDDIEQFVINLQNNRKVEVVDDEESLFCKLIAGDKKSDNIPSVFIRNDRGIGESGAMTIYDLYKKQHPDPINFCSREFVERASLTVAENKKDTSEKTISQIQKDIARNIKLIVLEDRFMPTELSETMQRMMLS